MLAALDDLDAAFDEAAKFQSGERFNGVSLFYPEMLAFQHDPRFMPLAARLGLAEFWTKMAVWSDFCAEHDTPYDCKAAAQAAINERPRPDAPPSPKIAGKLSKGHEETKLALCQVPERTSAAYFFEGSKIPISDMSAGGLGGRSESGRFDCWFSKKLSLPSLPRGRTLRIPRPTCRTEAHPTQSNCVE